MFGLRKYVECVLKYVGIYVPLVLTRGNKMADCHCEANVT